MKTRFHRFLVLSLFSAANLVLWPASSTAQVLEPCAATATLDPISQYTVTVQATASYSCSNPKMLINVTGCLLLNGVAVHCNGETKENSSEASVDLRFPCLPGVWSAVAIGAGADRVLPAAGAAQPQIVPLCDPMAP